MDTLERILTQVNLLQDASSEKIKLKKMSMNNKINYLDAGVQDAPRG